MRTLTIAFGLSSPTVEQFSSVVLCTSTTGRAIAAAGNIPNLASLGRAQKAGPTNIFVFRHRFGVR
jgi:hypothetical protein